MLWAPTVIDGSIPAGTTYDEANVVAYVSLNDFAGNFGHALYDFKFPVFNVLKLMKVPTGFLALLAKHQVSSPECRAHSET